MDNVLEIVGRATKNAYLTKSNDGQDISRWRIAVGNTYWILDVYGSLGQAMAHQIKRGMYVKLNATFEDYRDYKPYFANKPTDVWLASYDVIHFEKLDKQAYDNYKPGGQKFGLKVRLAMEGKCSKVFFIPAYTYLVDHVN